MKNALMIMTLLVSSSVFASVDHSAASTSASKANSRVNPEPTSPKCPLQNAPKLAMLDKTNPVGTTAKSTITFDKKGVR